MRHPFPAAPSPQAGLAVIISNGSAGQGRPPQWPRDVEDKCRSHGLNAKVVVVQSGEDIVRAAADAVQQGA